MSLTPEQFSKIALQKDLEELKGDVKLLSDNVSKILSAVDGITKQYDDYKTEHVANIAAHDRFEVRIKKLEKSAL